MLTVISGIDTCASRTNWVLSGYYNEDYEKGISSIPARKMYEFEFFS